MSLLTDLYRPSLSLLTDLYQVTMAYGYWKNGMAERESVFHLFYRKNPFQGGYALAAGLDLVLDYLENLRPDAADLAYLATLKGSDGARLLPDDFLEYLAHLDFSCEVDAVPEGTVVFAHEPLLRIRGPLLQCQWVETPLLTLLNFQTLIATKASRVVHAARGSSVMEFGLRRSQGPDGALGAARAAMIGGVQATSNVLAGRLLGIPVRGTHAHAWVMSFPDEPEAFRAYASAMPNNSLFLVDTYDTLEGVQHAVETGKWLREQGHEMLGIRLDSGDLAALAKAARQLLDAGGFPHARIVASNDLDEYTITQLLEAGAPIDTWGVGTKLATAYDQPALGGVYKLGALRNEHGAWDWKMKLSNDLIKVSNPGILNVKRLWQGEAFAGDVLYNTETGCTLQGLESLAGDSLSTPAHDRSTDLLVPVMRGGTRIHPAESLQTLQARAHTQLQALPPQLRALSCTQPAPLHLDPALAGLKRGLLEKLRG